MKILIALTLLAVSFAFVVNANDDGEGNMGLEVLYEFEGEECPSGEDIYNVCGQWCAERPGEIID